MLVVTVNGSRKILQKFITQKFNDCERAMHFYYGNNINNLIFFIFLGKVFEVGLI